jgi:hypothetical protein
MNTSQPVGPDLFNIFTQVLPDYWQRKRGSLGPSQVLYTIVRMAAQSTKSYRDTLDYLKRQVGDKLGWEAEPWASSFSEARRKLSAKSCHQSFHAVRQRCLGLQGMPKVSYDNYRLLAADMTRLALPSYQAISREFGHAKGPNGQPARAPQATLTALWDISTNTPVDWRLEKAYASERYAAYDMFAQLGPGDLVITDRGYPSRRLLKMLIEQKAGFLLRMTTGKAGSFTEVRQFAQDEHAWDREIMLHDTNKKQGEPMLRVRLMKRRLENGLIAVFATNLYGSRTHKRRALCDLYCYRWDIETAFREMKMWHGLENFSARYAEGIHQEVCGLMIFMLLTAELEAQARGYHDIQSKETSPDGPREPEYRFNRKQIAVSVGYILAAAVDGPEAVAAEYAYCMKQLWRYRQRRRPGRKFNRVAKDPNSKYKKTTRNTRSKQGA